MYTYIHIRTCICASASLMSLCVTMLHFFFCLYLYLCCHDSFFAYTIYL